ncbi:MAG: CoB--CoM heterodisulfide reductase iron-sulfur subunit B family protein [Lachnospiraceae bacterium]|nr:CoB--CoM heterodisulfide reductase iron-sulfur subunit B family protein [Candidatus Darwinimomas equi]
MKFSYFPGCTLKNKAKDLDEYARKSALTLGIQLEEIDEWQCCGGVFTTASDEVATKLSSVRALAAARAKNQDLVSVCSACHNVIKQTNYAMQTDREFADKVNRYMAPDIQYDGSTKVYHYLEVLRDVVGFDEIRKRTVNPLTGRKIGAYYGCLLLRPVKAMAMDDPENPAVMEDFIRAIGGEPVIYPYRNECCGGYISLEDPELAKKKSNMVSDSAAGAGADCIVTACPLCKYNLVKNGSKIPVVYFTELLAEALGIKEVKNV